MELETSKNGSDSLLLGGQGGDQIAIEDISDFYGSLALKHDSNLCTVNGSPVVSGCFSVRSLDFILVLAPNMLEQLMRSDRVSIKGSRGQKPDTTKTGSGSYTYSREFECQTFNYVRKIQV